MNLSQKNRMGAGDGIAIQATPAKKRPQVPSSRKFATRGVVCDSHVKKQLREALDQYSTPPESPLLRRSMTMAEITPVTRPSRQKPLSSDTAAAKHKALSVNGSRKTPQPIVNRKSNKLLQRCEKDEALMGAGRRVCHQIVLNAWRRQRGRLATMVDSCERFQTQADQLQRQVEVLQKLRESESARRVEAVNETNALMLRIDNVYEENEKLHNTIEDLMKVEELCKAQVIKLNDQIRNLHHCNSTLRGQRDYFEEALACEKQQVASTRSEIERLEKKLEECNAEREKHVDDCKMYEDAIKMSENKYVEIDQQLKSLQTDYAQLQRSREKLISHNHEMEDLITSCNDKCERMDSKMHDVKKLLNTSRQKWKRAQEDNETLRLEIVRMRDAMRTEHERQWWLKTGEFLFDKFTFCAYLLFPAMPPRVVPTDEENAMALESNW